METPIRCPIQSISKDSFGSVVLLVPILFWGCNALGRATITFTMHTPTLQMTRKACNMLVLGTHFSRTRLMVPFIVLLFGTKSCLIPCIELTEFWCHAFHQGRIGPARKQHELLAPKAAHEAAGRGLEEEPVGRLPDLLPAAVHHSDLLGLSLSPPPFIYLS